MKILLEHLRTFIDMPERPHDARELLDDVGIEVKTSETTSLGTVFNCELLANRGDHYSYAGIAREVSGRTGGRLRFAPVATLDVQKATDDRVRIESPLCLQYTVTELFAPDVIPSVATDLAGPGGAPNEPPGPAGSLADARDDMRPLPTEVLIPLTAADIHSISAAVDASNLANLDVGQPTHAFDGDTIDGPITIRTSRNGEKAWMLFTPEPAEIPEGTLVIADDSKILGIAGVIGCVESAVTHKTKRILLESATFDPVTVRISSRQLNQPTDAAARFMRGGDPSLPLVGAARVAYLLEKYSGWRIGTAYIAGHWRDPQRTIDVHVPWMRRFIGAELTAFEMADRLTRYGFAVEDPNEDTFKVIVPPGRLWDVHFEADLAEELVKSVGYNNTVVSLPHVTMGALPSHEENVVARVNDVLVAEGFYEIFTDSFYGPRMREKLGVAEGDPLWPHAELQNSQEKDYALMRNNTLAQALGALVTNLNLKTSNLKIYEWSRIYFAALSERAVLWGLVNGRDRGPFWGDKGRVADAIYVKGILEQLRLELRVDIRLGSSDGHRLERFFHPGRRAGIYVGGALRGIVGEVHPAVLQRFDIKRQRPVYFELETASLLAPPLPKTYTEPPTRQAVVRNVAYAVPRGTSADEVRTALLGAAPDFLREIRITDLFELPDANAVTFEIEYLADRSLTSEEVNDATAAMMAAVNAKLPNVTLRA